MKTMQDRLRKAQEDMRAIGAELERLSGELAAARGAWSADQLVRCDDWHRRAETPPAGHIWASDGTAVWLIHASGLPLPPEATRVKFWTRAFIPAPPAEEVL